MKKYLYKYRGRKKKRCRWLWDLVLILIFLSSLCWLLFKTPYFSIQEIEFSESGAIFADDIKKIIGDDRNFFLMGTVDTSQIIEKAFLKIRKVEIKKKFPNSIFVSITQREEVGIICSKDENSLCWLFSDDGVIFSMSDREKKEGLFLIFANEEAELKINKVCVEEELISNFIFLEDELEKLKIFIREIEISSSDIKIIIEDGFEIYFSKSIDKKMQIEVLLQALQGIISEEEKNNLEYIDLRDLQEGEKGKVYFK